MSVHLREYPLVHVLYFALYLPSASEVTTLWRYTNLFIIIIICPPAQRL